MGSIEPPPPQSKIENPKSKIPSSANPGTNPARESGRFGQRGPKLLPPPDTRCAPLLPSSPATQCASNRPPAANSQSPIAAADARDQAPGGPKTRPAAP